MSVADPTCHHPASLLRLAVLYPIYGSPIFCRSIQGVLDHTLHINLSQI